MKLLVIAGPPSSGKTSLVKQIVKKMKHDMKIAFFKIDVVKAFEDVELNKEFGILARKFISGDLCPDHASVMVLGDAVEWAETNGAELFIVESAGLCLRCSPYLNQGLGIIVLSSIAGIHAPEKMGCMVTLADIAVVTKIDLVSQAEREVLVQKIKETHPDLILMETNALQGTSLHRLYEIIRKSSDIDAETLVLKGNPPLHLYNLCRQKRNWLETSLWGDSKTRWANRRIPLQR